MYLVFTTGLFLLSVFFTAGIHNPGHLEQNYFRSTSYLFILAAVLIGGAIYSYQAYTRKYREHAWDSLLLLVTGLALMGTVLFIILYYGGLEGTFTESGYTAANVNIVVLAMLPLPFFVRTAVLVLSLQEPPARASDCRADRLCGASCGDDFGVCAGRTAGHGAVYRRGRRRRQLWLGAASCGYGYRRLSGT